MSALHRPGWQRCALALLAIGALLAARPGTAAVVTWGSWNFTWQVSGDHDGLSLTDVKYQGRTVLGKLSFPVMRVFYTNNACGPYADVLGWQLAPIPWANDETVAQRQFTLNGRNWYEIGIRGIIGDYDIYQVYYLSDDGQIDGHIYSRGLQCLVNHVHYPNWRIDLDLDGKANDRIQRLTATGVQTMTQEFKAAASSALSHGWRVRDSVTGMQVDVLPGFADFRIPNMTIVPESTYSNNTVFGRFYKAAEDVEWTFGPNVQVPFGNNESIDNTDVVLWYEGFLPHLASEGQTLWHSTGIRLVTLLSPPPDTDSDGVANTADNCTAVANASQLDTDNDGYGNACDPDFNNNGTVDSQDATLLRKLFGATDAPLYDLNGSGVIDSQDASLFRAAFGQAPGPSGLHP